MEVIPVINCLDEECAIKKLHEAEKFSDWIHLDVADGRFTFNKTWGTPKAWAALRAKVNLEAHLMVEEPENCVDDWISAGAKRLIIHLETTSKEGVEKIIATAKKRGAEVMLAINPETPLRNLEPYIKDVSRYHLLAVHPGLPGQKFLPTVLEKVKILRQELPDAKIEIDGGINPEVVRAVKAAGADIVVSGTYIFGGEDSKAKFEELKKA